MAKRVDEKYGMLTDVQFFLSEELAALVAAVPMIGTVKTDLDNLIADLFKEMVKVGGKKGAYAAAKKAAREAVSKQAYDVANAAALYYTYVVNDELLRNRVKVRESGLKLLTTDSLLERVRQINETALPVAALLGPYGMPQAGVLALGGLIDAFFNLKDRPREQAKLEQTARKKIKKLIKQADELLVNLSYMMRSFETNNPTLFNQYKSALKINHLPTNRLMKKGVLQKEKETYARYAKGYLTADTKILLSNESARTKAGTLLFYFAEKAGSPLPQGAQMMEVAGGSQKTIVCGKNGFSAETPVLMIVNRSAKPIKWRTRVVTEKEEGKQ